MVQGASQAQEVRNRKASPEGPGEGAEAQAEAFKNGSEGTGRMEARKRTIRERETRQVEARRKLSFNDNGDAEAGPEGRLRPARGASRTRGGAGERADFGRTRVFQGSRARWSTDQRELAYRKR
jgi:hypothetical protein